MNKNITATILIVLAIGIYFTVTKGMFASANTVKAVNDQYSAAIDSATQLISLRDKALSDFNNLSQTDRDNLTKMLPTSVDNIRLVIDLNSIATKHGFSLKNIKAAVSDDNGSNQAAPTADAANSNGLAENPGSLPSIAVPVLDTVTVSFGVTAPYEQFISFMQDLESNVRIMDITHLSLSANDTGTYDFSVELKTYWLRSQ